MMWHSRGHLAASLSVLVPGLGQAARGHGKHALLIITITGVLLAIAWSIGRTAGISAVVFFVMLIVLPWWSIQAYDAFLEAPARPGLGQTLGTIWQRAHDIRYLGALFLLTALTDLYIIIANPQYSLTVFCMKPGGLLGGLAKAQSPTLHTLIGYGFLRLRRWSLFVYLAYATFGLLNATANYACFGYGRVRTAFLLTLLAFTGYILWRRDRFQPATAPRSTL